MQWRAWEVSLYLSYQGVVYGLTGPFHFANEQRRVCWQCSPKPPTTCAHICHGPLHKAGHVYSTIKLTWWNMIICYTSVTIGGILARVVLGKKAAQAWNRSIKQSWDEATFYGEAQMRVSLVSLKHVAGRVVGFGSLTMPTYLAGSTEWALWPAN